MVRRTRAGERSRRAPGADPSVEGFRRSFIRTNMLFVLIVLAVVVALAGAVNYRSDVANVQKALDDRAAFYVEQAQLDAGPAGGVAADASAPQGDAAAPAGEASGEGAQGSQGERPSQGDGSGRPGQGRDTGAPRESGSDQVVATSAYSIDESGAATVLDDTLNLDSDTLSSAVEAARGALSDSGGQEAGGRIGRLNLYYKIVADDTGTYLVLASGNYIYQSMLALMGALGAAAVVGFAAFFGASVFLARRAVAPVERAWREQKQFIADASHELKTPLTVILANASILKARPEKSVGSQMKWVDSTEAEAHQMQGLVGDMLYLAQVEDGRAAAVVRERVCFSKAVQGTVLQFESVAFERGVELEDDVEEGLYVEGDAARLQRMCATLVDNACKYAGKGGRVRVELHGRGRACLLMVRNTGEAIAPEDLPHVFDRFYRADKARTSGKGGFGLGLSIAQGIARDHGGSISAASSQDAGTVFTVTLPRAR